MTTYNVYELHNVKHVVSSSATLQNNNLTSKGATLVNTIEAKSLEDAKRIMNGEPKESSALISVLNIVFNIIFAVIIAGCVMYLSNADREHEYILGFISISSTGLMFFFKTLLVRIYENTLKI